MRKKILLGLLAAVVLGVVVTLLIRAQPSVDIVAGSSYITNIIEDVSDGKLETRTFAAPAMCPSQSDVKPSDIKALAGSKALLIHNYQQSFQNIARLIEAADNPGLIVWVADIAGNWMTPPVQAQAVDTIAQALGEIDPENAAHYAERAAERVQVILAKGDEVESRLLQAGVDGVKVICADMQAGFVMWTGFDVVATYGRPEDLSPQEMAQSVDTAREAGVALVIDNLQSGATENSETLASDIEAIQVTISNFPGGFADTESWEKALDKNVDLLLEALAEWSEQYG